MISIDDSRVHSMRLFLRDQGCDCDGDNEVFKTSEKVSKIIILTDSVKGNRHTGVRVAFYDDGLEISNPGGAGFILYDSIRSICVDFDKDLQKENLHKHLEAHNEMIVKSIADFDNKSAYNKSAFEQMMHKVSQEKKEAWSCSCGKCEEGTD